MVKFLDRIGLPVAASLPATGVPGEVIYFNGLFYGWTGSIWEPFNPAPAAAWTVAILSTGVSQNITLPESGVTPADVIVTVAGLVQDPVFYTITGTTLNLTAPDTDLSIVVRKIAGAGSQSFDVFTAAANGLVPAPVTPSGKFLRDDGIWANLNAAPTTVSTTTYTLILSDSTAYVRFTNAGGCVITIPPNSEVAFEIGVVITMRAATAGSVSLAAGAGVTLNRVGGASGVLTFVGEGATVQVKKVATNEWDIIGETG